MEREKLVYGVANRKETKQHDPGSCRRCQRMERHLMVIQALISVNVSKDALVTNIRAMLAADHIRPEYFLREVLNEL